MVWVDGHLDLAYLAVRGRDLTRPAGPQGGCVSLPDLRAARVDLLLATIFTEGGAAARRAGLRQLAIYDDLAARGEVVVVGDRGSSPDDARRPAIVLLMEGADPIDGPDDVAFWHGRGVRVVGLTWARGTRYAGGDRTGGPLTPAGLDLVAAFDAAGIVHDASHLSDASFDALMNHARGPVVATHSNCRALVGPHERHLRDDQIAAIGARGGIVGLNLFTRFLAVDRRATIRDCVANVEHVAGIMGHRRGVGLGSDMDGGFGPEHLPEGLDHPTRLAALADALRDAGWSADEVDDFRAGNWQRLLATK
jgi:membrane dipeptidase